MVNDLSFSESESNFAMGVVDAMFCFLGILTSILGMWIDGFSVFMAGILTISILLGFASYVRFTRERDMSKSDIGSPWRTH